MRFASIVALAFALALAPATARADRSYTTEKSATHDCTKDPNASINTGSGTYTFTGTCDKITINGGSNTVTIEAVKKLGINGSKNVVEVTASDRIGVNGSDNSVTYKKGITTKLPKVGAIGSNNKLNAVAP